MSGVVTKGAQGGNQRGKCVTEVSGKCVTRVAVRVFTEVSGKCVTRVVVRVFTEVSGYMCGKSRVVVERIPLFW